MDALQNAASIQTDVSRSSGNRFIIRGFANNGVVTCTGCLGIRTT